jgi:hypothetical protein
MADGPHATPGAPPAAGDDLPPAIVGPAAWRGPEMAARSDAWTWTWGEAEIAELEQALGFGAGRDPGAPAWPVAQVALPGLGPRLDAMREELLHGRGFALIRGLPVGRWSRAQSAHAFLALGARIGSARSQNAAGHLLGHVKDLGLESRDPAVRIYQTSERQSFHTDSCDVVALLCLREARSGGESLLVSAMTIWNEIRARRPDLALELTRPLATDRRGEVPEGMKPWFLIPPLSWHAGELTVHYQRQYVDSAQRFDEAPRLGPRQVEALDLFDALANDPDLNLSMHLRPGDVQLVYNHALLHDRTAFTDWPEVERRRHLLRLWLAVPGDRELPACFAQRFGSVTVGDRGGVLVPGTRLKVPLEA